FIPSATPVSYTLSLHDALPICNFTRFYKHDFRAGRSVATLNDIHVLVVDDNKQMRFLVRCLLRAGGINKVTEAETGAQAFDVMRDRKSTRLNSSHVKISYAVFC